MLLHLHVKNLALIREAEIDFAEGLNILTGETGAGKSILIGSMTMALGGKVSKEMIREDADYALAELIFETDRSELLKRLSELEIPVEDGQVILSRKLSGSRSICRLNGETVSTAVLKEISSMLIDIHGQHEHQSLLNKRKHLEILDSYTHETLDPVKASLNECWKRCRKLKTELEAAGMDETERNREQSLLEFELNEIEEAKLKDGEDECAGAGNGCQRAVAQQVADDEGIGGIIQLLEQKAQKQRDRKGYQLFGNGTFCHSYLGFGHSAGTPFFLPFSPLWGKLTVV